MSTIKTETLSTPSNATVPVDTVVNGTAKAWVNFNGSGTVAIRRAFNVASITDNGTGNYTVNFTTAMVDGDFSAVASTNRNSLTGNVHPNITVISPTVSAISVFTGPGDSVSTLQDHVYIFVAIFS